MPIRTYFPGRGTMIEQALLEGEAKGRAEGRAWERALMVMRVLRNRDVAVSPEVRERVSSCTDLDTLERWLDRAFIVATAEELFSEQD
ncbi:hypothetical protein ACH427_05965 [Streptomyces sp. NPDC020379]|uniref:hypothetical protein n=1 Tax=Streptomyces sp. NPDC020379 TaxID=3365071 RepID=UPI00378D333A